MFGFRKKKAAPPPERVEIYIESSDDLMTRAENIVAFMGFSGFVGNRVVDVYRLLKKYEDLDNEDKNLPTGSKPNQGSSGKKENQIQRMQIIK